MGRQLAVGDEAPDFDLSSTEGVVLMLRDEVPRNVVLLYFFPDPASEAARRDLAVLAAARDALAAKRVNLLAIAPAKMPDLSALQAELGLPFPLLRDDRGLSDAYGVDLSEEGAPALVLVGRDQRVLAIANPATEVERQLGELEKALDGRSSPTANYPKSVINRLVDRWVN